MARARRPNRDRAETLYLESGGNLMLKDIAEQFGVIDSLICKLKNQDKWDEKLNGNVTIRKGNVIVKDPKPKIAKAVSVPVKTESTELCEKQRLFVLVYLRDFNGNRAAIAVGYNKMAAYAFGWKKLVGKLKFKPGKGSNG
nr:phage terminase small subunit-related protein [Brevibacillus sp. HB1.2]